jgi:hypothetical protein
MSTNRWLTNDISKIIYSNKNDKSNWQTPNDGPDLWDTSTKHEQSSVCSGQHSRVAGCNWLYADRLALSSRICRYIIDMVTVLPCTNVNIWSTKFLSCLSGHIPIMSLLATVFRANAFAKVLSAFFCHLEVIIWTSWGANAIYILRCVRLIACFYIRPNLGPLDWRNWDIIICAKWMKNLVVIC